MKTWIWKKFIKDYENVRDPEVRGRYTKLTGTLGIIVNTVLCVIKIILGAAIGSIAVIADGIHDMADSLAACITLLGAYISRRPADSEHPYGHARAEYLASLAVSAIVLIVGVELMKNSVDKILHPTPTEFSWLMVGFMIFAILLKGSQALFTIATGKHIDSLPVIAAGTDNRNDVITSIIIVAGMLIHHFAGLDLDGWMGGLVSLFILWSGITLIKNTISPILGESPDEDLMNQMEEIIASHPQILGIHDLRVYNYGPGRNFATFHAEVDASSDLLAVHDQIDHIERELSQKLGIEVTGHMDPVVLDDPLQDQLQQAVADALSSFDNVEDFHDLRIVSDPAGKTVCVDIVLKDPKELKSSKDSKDKKDSKSESKASEGELRAAVYNAVNEIEPLKVAVTFDHSFL